MIGQNLPISTYVLENTNLVKSTSYTVTGLEATKIINIFADGTDGSVTITLPLPIYNVLVLIKKIDNTINDIVIDTQGGATIDGNSSITTNITGDSYSFINNGVNWFII